MHGCMRARGLRDEDLERRCFATYMLETDCEMDANPQSAGATRGRARSPRPHPTRHSPRTPRYR